MALRDNIVGFPLTDNIKYRTAVEKFSSNNFEEALIDAISLIDDGYSHANTLAGCIYEMGGRGVVKDPAKALFYFNKAVEEVGAVEAWLGLARLYYKGEGVPQDYNKSFSYYLAVDEDAQHPVAWIMLGRMYRQGKGTPKNNDIARVYLNKAKKCGYVHALMELGLLETEAGNAISGWILRFEAQIKLLLLSMFSPRSSRLRES